MKKDILKYRSIGLSVRSGKTDESEKKVGGIKTAAQKTSFSLKVANVVSVVWSKKKIKNIHTDTTCAKIQNLLLITFAGFLKSTKTPMPAIKRNIKMNITWLAIISSISKNIS